MTANNRLFDGGPARRGRRSLNTRTRGRQRPRARVGETSGWSRPPRRSPPTGCRPATLFPQPSSSSFNRRCCWGSRRSAGWLTPSAAVQIAGFDPGPRAVFGQALAHLCFALLGLALYLIVLPRVYDFSTLGPSPSVRTIVETYFTPNKTFPELRELDEQPRD